MVTKYLVTGASGYIAMHVVDQLLKQGQFVRGTIRSLNDINKVEALKKLGPVELVEADLLDADSWKKAVKGIDIILHIASPLPANLNAIDENVIIKTTVEGTLNVLKASIEENIKRVVFTSTALAANTGEYKIYTEEDWAEVEKAQSAYQKAKILAERAAWKFYEEHKNKGFKLVTLLPVVILGPVLSSTSTASAMRFMCVFDRTLQSVENAFSGVCDVRDVALAHIRSAQLDEAVGHRFLIVSSTRMITTAEWTDILRQAGYKVVQVVANLDKAAYEKKGFDDTKMRRILKIEPIAIKQTVLDMAESLISYGLITP